MNHATPPLYYCYRCDYVAIHIQVWRMRYGVREGGQDARASCNAREGGRRGDDSAVSLQRPRLWQGLHGEEKPQCAPQDQAHGGEGMADRGLVVIWWHQKRTMVAEKKLRVARSVVVKIVFVLNLKRAASSVLFLGSRDVHHHFLFWARPMWKGNLS